MKKKKKNKFGTEKRDYASNNDHMHTERLEDSCRKVLHIIDLRDSFSNENLNLPHNLRPDAFHSEYRDAFFLVGGRYAFVQSYKHTHTHTVQSTKRDDGTPD